MIFSPLTLLILVTAVIAMVVFGYISKSNQRSAQVKTRRIARLKERARKLDNIIFGLPVTYLPKTLKVLIYASIVDSLRQIHSLSGNDSINQQIERVRQTLSTLVELEPSPASIAASQDSAMDLKECKHLLKDLYSLILEFHSEGSLDKSTTQSHLDIVKSLMLKVTLDTYKAAADVALTDNNTGLAHHYSLMALKRLTQDNPVPGFNEQKRYFQEQVSLLEQRMQSEKANSRLVKAGAAEHEAALQQRQTNETPTDDWKKKRY